MMKVIIRSIDQTLFEGQANEAALPGLFGKVGIKPYHATLSVILTSGKICLNLEDKVKKFAITEGVAHVSNNIVDILLVA